MFHLKFQQIIKDLIGNKITKLIINEPLSQKEIKEIAEALKKNTGLLELRLEDNNIGNDGVLQLANALKVNTRLQILSILRNGVTDLGASVLANALKTNKSLIKLSLDGRAVLSHFKDDALDYSTNNIGNDGADEIAEMLLVNNTLQELYLSFNQIDEKGVYNLYNALKTNSNSKLKKLDVYGSKFLKNNHPHLKLTEKLCENNKNKSPATTKTLTSDKATTETSASTTTAASSPPIAKYISLNLSAEELYQISTEYEAEENYLESFQYLLQAAEKKHIKALYAIYRLNDIYVDPEDNTASTQFRKKYLEDIKQTIKEVADKGDSEAQVTLGQMISEKDSTLAMQYFKQAAEQGSAKGNYYVGNMLRDKDKINSIEYFTRAAKAGFLLAFVELGRAAGTVYHSQLYHNKIDDIECAMNAFTLHKMAYLGYSKLVNSKGHQNIERGILLDEVHSAFVEYARCFLFVEDFYEIGKSLNQVDENRASQIISEANFYSDMANNRYRKLRKVAEQFLALKQNPVPTEYVVTPLAATAAAANPVTFSAINSSSLPASTNESSKTKSGTSHAKINF